MRGRTDPVLGAVIDEPQQQGALEVAERSFGLKQLAVPMATSSAERVWSLVVSRYLPSRRACAAIFSRSTTRRPMGSGGVPAEGAVVA